MRTSSATAQQQIAAASNGAARQALARDASMAEGVRWSSEMIAAGGAGGVHVVEEEDGDFAFEYAPGQRDREEAEDRALAAAQESDPRYQALAAEIDALREAEDEADPAPGADQAACVDADFARINEAELADSETALTLYRALCRADRAALPAIKPVHQHAGLLSNILARAMRAALDALIHARLRVAHSCITARILRAGRAVAATSAAPASLCC